MGFLENGLGIVRFIHIDVSNILNRGQIIVIINNLKIIMFYKSFVLKGMETILTYNTNSNTSPVCGGRAINSEG